MAHKITKAASIIDELHSIVLKQAEAQSTVVGTPGGDTKPAKTTESTEKIDKNTVVPETNKQEVKQDGASLSAGKVVSAGGVKAASDLPSLSEEILSLIKKHADVQDAVVGTPGGDTKPASPDKATETIDKNKVVPEDNKQEVVQAKSTEEAGKVVSDAAAKTAAVVTTPAPEVKKLASEVSAYNLGASLIYDLVAGSTVQKSAADVAMCKSAGRRDMDALVAQMVPQIKQSANQPVVTAPAPEQEKVAAEVAEQAGGAYFDELYKAASDNLLVEKVASLEQELEQVKQANSAEALAKQAELDKVAAEQREEAMIAKIAAAVTTTLEAKLKSEPAKQS